MLSRLTLAAVFAALPAIVSAADAPARTPPEKPKVTIRGTGKNVVIERSDASPSEKAISLPPEAADPIDDAIALKTRGASDATVLSFLRAHEDGLPPIIDSQDVRRLRRAGAGRSVVNWLASAAAVDIGETGEGHEAIVLAGPAPAGPEGFADGASYVYPLYGSYAAYPRGFRHRVVPRVRRMMPPPRRPGFAAFPRPRAAFSRHPFAP